MSRGYGFHTVAAAHADDVRTHRPLNVPILQTSIFQYASSADLAAEFQRRGTAVYTRFGHPTLQAAADKVAALEGAEAALTFSSGMAAITTALFTVLDREAHIVAQRSMFAQTATFLRRLETRYGVAVDFVDPTDPQQVADAIRPQTKVIYAETPSNPLLAVVDLAAIAAIGNERGVPVFVDGTFASPYLQSPLALGATLVLHSASKYLGGHADLLCGAAAGDADLIGALRESQILLGGTMDPHAAWLLMRGIKTLGIRVERQSSTALQIAEFLEGQDAVRRVHYPFLASSPSYDVARRQMRAGGGIVSFEIQGGLEEARRFVDALRLIPIATSLGGVETVVEVPYDLDFSHEQLGEDAEQTGVAPGLIRLSVGLEDPGDLERDLRHGLDAVTRTASISSAPQRNP